MNVEDRWIDSRLYPGSYLDEFIVVEASEGGVIATVVVRISTLYHGFMKVKDCR